MKYFASILSILVFVLTASTAAADNRVVVRPFFGPHSEKIRREVVRILKQHDQIKLVRTQAADRSARKLGVDANSPEGRTAVAAELSVAAWIEAIVQRHGRDLRVTVLVYDGDNHKRVARSVITRRRSSQLVSALRKKLWGDTRQALLTSQPPSRDDFSGSSGDEAIAEADEDDETESTDEDEAFAADDSAEDDTATAASADASEPAKTSADSSMALEKALEVDSARWDVRPAGAVTPVDGEEVDTGERGRAIDARIGIGTLTRTLSFQDPFSDGLGDYSLPAAAQAELDVRIYPAGNTNSWLGNIGFDLHGQFGLTGASQTTSGDEFKTGIDAAGAGLRVRLPFGEHEASLVGSYNLQRFRFEDAGDAASPTPDVDYRYYRVGMEGDFALADSFSAGISGGYMIIESAGELAEWFPRATGAGLEASAFGSLALTKRLDMLGKVSLQHFYFDFNSEPGDELAAGGATDDFVTVTFALRYYL